MSSGVLRHLFHRDRLQAQYISRESIAIWSKGIMSRSSSSFGKKISPDSPMMEAIRHNSPDSCCETKKRRMPRGQASGCCFRILSINPSGRLPLEKATLAKRAVLMFSLPAYAIISSSISFLLAPIILTGLAALSVETQKKCSGGHIQQEIKQLTWHAGHYFRSWLL